MSLQPHAMTACQVVLATPGAWHLRQTAKAFESRGALAGMWTADKNATGISPDLFRRCWPFHLGMKPFYHLAPQIIVEHLYYRFFPIWKTWLQFQSWPVVNVVHSPMGFATEPFRVAEKVGALKVVDCPNSHPSTYYGFWQRECDLWCSGEKVPVPRWYLARATREIHEADVVLCPSTFVRDSMLLNGIPEEKLVLNPFGVDTAMFTPRKEPPSRPKFVSVGTISVRKGFQYLFRAFDIVKNQYPEAELVVAGDYKVDFRREKSKWAGSFNHVGHITHQELARLFQESTAFVFPSCEEGFARVIPEAMAAGLPIIASHESGATTLVEDGVQGFIVKSQDPSGIAARMIQLIENPKLGAKLGQAAHVKGAVKNTWQDYGDRLLDEYERRLVDRQSDSCQQS